MAGGIDLTPGNVATLAEASSLAIVSATTGSLSSSGITKPTLGPYRDKQQNKPAVYSITTVTSSGGPAVGTIATVDANGNSIMKASPTAKKTTAYVFDAVLVANHMLAYEATNKPLQSGYNTSDHIIKLQPEVTLQIGMSDAMAAFAPGVWIGNPSKSISAWQVIVGLADNRALMTLATRQQTYKNMAILRIGSPETNKTIKGLSVSVTFRQMLLVDVTSESLSARPNATDQTPQATLQTSDPSTTLTQQHSVDNTTLPVGNSNSIVNSNDVSAGGEFSSNNIVP